MRKRHLLSLFLAAVMLVQSAVLPVWAQEDADQSDDAEQTVAEETLPEGETEQTESTEPSAQPNTTPIDVPSDFDGDASVTYGSHSLNAQYPVIAPGELEVEVKAAVAYEVGTDTMVYADHADERLYPASMTKIMTCLVALEMCDLSEIVTVDGAAIEYLDIGGSEAELVDGEQMTMQDLLYCLMVMSANDAAVTIAAHLAGSEEAFVERMNQKAAELGCTNTHFANAHGLHDENHYTTARDMARIMTACIQNEEFCKLYSETYHMVPATNLSPERELYTTNYLMSEALNQNYYDSRVLGGKTGFTTPAGRCLITVSESAGMKLVIVIMGAEAEFAEDGYTALSYGNFDATVELMDKIYGGYMPAQILSADQMLEQFPVNNGQTQVQGCTKESAGTVIPAGSGKSALRYDYSLNNGGVSAPLQSGSEIGTVRVWYQSQCVAQQTMYAGSDVKMVVPDETPKYVNPAAQLKDKTSVWNIVLIVILVVFGLIALLVVGISIRNRIIRARRRKARAMRRNRRRQQQ